MQFWHWVESGVWPLPWKLFPRFSLPRSPKHFHIKVWRHCIFEALPLCGSHKLKCRLEEANYFHYRINMLSSKFFFSINISICYRPICLVPIVLCAFFIFLLPCFVQSRKAHKQADKSSDQLRTTLPVDSLVSAVFPLYYFTMFVATPHTYWL